MSDLDFHLYRREALSGLSAAVRARALVKASESVDEALERIGEFARSLEAEARFWGAPEEQIKSAFGAPVFDFFKETDYLVSDFFEYLDSIVTKG